MNKEAVERAAMAIHRTFANKSRRGKEWSQLQEALRERYREEARAALEAVRDSCGTCDAAQIR